MLLVNNPGTWAAIWWPLEHAEWHGWTPTDLIFPFFLFIVGITTELSRKEPLRFCGAAR
jgi:predicted acyltransferase